MKGFRWYLFKTLRSWRKAKIAYHNFDVISRMVVGMERALYEAFYTFVATHKYLKILNTNFDLFEVEDDVFKNWLRVDGYDKYLNTKTRYYINLETQKIEYCEPI